MELSCTYNVFMHHASVLDTLGYFDKYIQN